MSSADLTVLRYIPELTIGVTPNDAVKAQGTLTASSNFADTETVTINGKVYTFQTTLTNVNGNVKLGASLTDSLANLRKAIDLSGVAGTDYAAAMTEHPTVEPVSSNATTLVVRAKAAGTAGNALTTTDTATNASWGGGTLSGGLNSTVTNLTQVRYTGESLNYNIENTKTAEIRPDRAETDLVQSSASAAGDINFELSFDSFKDFLAGVFCNDWVSLGGGVEELENGILRKSFTIQKHFQDMDVPQYHNYVGCVPNGMSLSMEIGKIIEGSFSFMAFGVTPTPTQFPGASLVNAPDTTPMSATANVRTFVVDGVPFSGCISKLSLEIANGVRAINCIGSLKPRNMKLGTLEVTGEMEFYFNDGSNYDKFVNGTEFDFSIELVDDDGNTYLLEIPRAKFETGEVVAGGRNSDVMFSATWRGLYDQSSGNVIKLTATEV